jgi:hypothetical protein
VAGSIYGRPITEPVFSVEATRWEFRLASMEWHAFLQIPSVMSKKPRKGTQAAAVRREAVEEKYRPWNMMQLVDVDSELKRLLGEQAAFRSVEARHPGDHTVQEPGGSHNEHRGGQERVVHVAGVGVERGDNRGGAAGCIAVQLEGPVRAVEDCERRVERPAAARVGKLCSSRSRPRWARRLGIISTASGQ